MTKKEKQFIEDMKRCRGLDFVRTGMMIEVQGEIATVMGMSPSANLIVIFANQLKHGKDEKRCHPTFETRYFDAEGNVIADYRKVKKQRCKVCGCTDDDCSQCIVAHGYPWKLVEYDLCARCEDDAINNKLWGV